MTDDFKNKFLKGSAEFTKNTPFSIWPETNLMLNDFYKRPDVNIIDDNRGLNIKNSLRHIVGSAREYQHYPYLANPFWLLQGVGEMFVSEEDKSKANMPANIDLSNTVFIPVVNMDVSAGFGSLTEEIESTKDFVSFGKDWIKKHISANVNNLVMFTVRGDSMDGGNSRIKNGSQIIVDTSVKEYINDGIYAIRIENALFVKRLQYMPGKLLVKSDNPIYQPFEVDLKTDSVNIIGAVVYVMNDMSCI